jgi:Bax protein
MLKTNKRYAVTLIIVIVTMVLVALLFNEYQKPTKPIVAAPTAFSNIDNTSKHKVAFYQTLLPLINAENQTIRKQRTWLLENKEKILAGHLNSRQTKMLNAIETDYGISRESSETNSFPIQMYNELITRVDMLPPALVLAQAANESAWGTSRFARLGNNYFGQWCYLKGCGIVPSARADGANHEVKKYSSVDDSLHDYFLNINHNNAYKELRSIRASRREQDKAVMSKNAALHLAEGLIEYSQRRGKYVDIIKSIIQSNQKIIDEIEKSSNKNK